MRGLRRTRDWTVTETARGFGCSPSHITRVELGANRPSRALVAYYEEEFEGDGLLLSLFEAVDHAAEQKRRRAGGRRATLVRGVPGDASTLVSQTIPDGTAMAPRQLFAKSWRVRNSGTVPWVGRRLERQGPVLGPGLIISPPSVDLPDAQPGEEVEVSIGLRAPTYDCSSIAYFKMVDSDGFLCFPDAYELGLTVLVRVSADVPLSQFRQ